jgi:asparagine synthase (glutamine-hydrolysing)
MCGIAGKLHWAQQFDESLIDRMNQCISHRGPDDNGKTELPEISLGHRRLSIIDLSASAKQPMQDSSGRYSIVFNGEIYNYQQLKDELLKYGYKFNNRSDTEVVINAYAKWGTACLEKFNGMFAFVIWDSQTKELFAARDRFGKKPFYYAYKNSQFIFASEISAILQDKTVSRDHDIEALNCYLALGYIMAPMSFYKEIKKLRPAHYILIKNKGTAFTEQPYWNYAHAFDKKTRQNAAEIKENILHHLYQSVRYRLIADVPVGAFLSGGIDSSSIVSVISKVSTAPLHTFNIGFEQSSYNEADDALNVSKLFNTQHHATLLRGDNPEALINNSINAFDEPFADNSLIPMYEVSKLAAQQVKVVLSGDGADELFAGYITYKADRYFSVYKRTPQFLRKAASSATKNLKADSKQKIGFKYKLKQFLSGAVSDEIQAHYSWRLFFNPEERIKILGEQHRQLVYDTDPIFRFRKFYENMNEKADWLDKHLYVDCMTWLPDDILTKVDRTTMKAGLEARAPYLDVHFAEYAASIPSELKLRKNETKYILKSALEKILPHDVLYKKKSGFNAPVGTWIGMDESDEFKSFNKFVYLKKV